jgi:hypothetical protein
MTVLFVLQTSSRRRLFTWKSSLIGNALIATLSLFNAAYFFAIADRVIVTLDLTPYGPLVTRLGQLSVVSLVATALGTVLCIFMSKGTCRN